MTLQLSDLSRDQREAYDAILRWTRDPSGKGVLSLGGYAGSGKSSLLALLAEEPLGPIAFVAPTGKAASILRRRLGEANIQTRSRLPRNERLWERYGLDPRAPFCGTLHSLVYAPVEDDKTGRVTGWAEQTGLDVRYKLIVIDEASMCSDAVVEHVKSYGVPILLVGDHGQLPPVRGCSQAMLRPDLRLEKIHRQAEDNPILKLSARIRENGRVDASLADGLHVRVLPETALRDELDAYETPGLDVMARAFVVYTNKRRVGLNAAIRDRMGHPAWGLVNGDQVICLKNRPGSGVYNGMRGLISEMSPGIRPWQARSVVDFPDDNVQSRLDLCQAQFGRAKTFEEFAEVEDVVHARIEAWTDVGALFDYGYVVTGHKMQGAQAADVTVLAEQPSMVPDELFSKWLYTCVTRATDRVTILL